MSNDYYIKWEKSNDYQRALIMKKRGKVLAMLLPDKSVAKAPTYSSVPVTKFSTMSEKEITYIEKKLIENYIRKICITQ